jgi:hypothetical protein
VRIWPNGTWTTPIVTGGFDHEATEIRAYLFPASFDVPLINDQFTLPESLAQNAADVEIVVRN